MYRDSSANVGGEEGATLMEYLETPKFLQASANTSRFSNNSEKIVPLMDLLYHGSLYLLERAEYISGQDIASLFLETSTKHLSARSKNNTDQERDHDTSSILYHSKQHTTDYDICQKIANIVVLLPNTEIGQTKFVAEALKLLQPELLNRDLLHNCIASKYQAHQDFANARYHFLHCASLENAEDIAGLLVEFHTKNALKSEIDIFITQFILQFLCLQNPSDPPLMSNRPGQSRLVHQRPTGVTPSNLIISKKPRATIGLIARKVFSTYATKHPHLTNIEVPFESMPLLNFTHFLISLLDSKNSEAETFKLLTETYKIALITDPNYQSYLNRIGVIYFGLPDQAKQQQQQQAGLFSGGLFNNILMSLLDGADGEEEVPSGHGSGNQYPYDDSLD